MKNKITKVVVKSIEHLAKISVETTSHIGCYQPKTPKSLKIPDEQEQQQE